MGFKIFKKKEWQGEKFSFFLQESFVFLKGMVLGFSMFLPGVSGGTMAFVLGIYEKLLLEASKFQIQDLKVMHSFKKYDFLFLVPLIFGLICSLIAFVFLAPEWIENYKFQFHSLIFGFVLASCYVPFKKMKKTFQTLSFFIAASFISYACFAFPGLSFTMEESLSLWLFFPVGMIVALALVIPGLSGSYLLILLGFYNPLLRILRKGEILYLLIFSLGLVVGFLLMVRLMLFLLKKYPSEIMALILGLIVGSLPTLWPFSMEQGALDFFSSSLRDKTLFFVWFLFSFVPTFSLSFFYRKKLSFLLK